jgi:hypothetical protein
MQSPTPDVKLAEAEYASRVKKARIEGALHHYLENVPLAQQAKVRKELLKVPDVLEQVAINFERARQERFPDNWERKRPRAKTENLILRYLAIFFIILAIGFAIYWFLKSVRAML